MKAVIGLIDIALLRWKPAEGEARPVMRNKSAQLLCPLCSQDRDENLLHQLPAQPVWACDKGHTYQAGEIPTVG
jgi:hypothetical protein